MPEKLFSIEWNLALSCFFSFVHLAVLFFGIHCIILVNYFLQNWYLQTSSTFFCIFLMLMIVTFFVFFLLAVKITGKTETLWLLNQRHCFHCKFWTYGVLSSLHGGRVPDEWVFWDGDLKKIPKLPSWCTPKDFDETFTFEMVTYQHKQVRAFLRHQISRHHL